MEILVASAIGILIAGGVFLMLRARTFDVIVGLTLLSYAVNVMIFAMGRIKINLPPIIEDGKIPDFNHYTDALPQALVLTAIVIAFAMTALLLVLAVRARADLRTDHVDGVEPRTGSKP